MKINALKSPSGAKLPPQAATIVQVLLDSGPLTRECLFEELAPKIKTTQPIARIYAFYRGLLLKQGFIKEIEESEVEPVEAEPTRALATFKVNGQSPVTCRVIRGFKDAQGRRVVLCGEDEDDQDLWVLQGTKAMLLGTLTKPGFSKAVRAAELNLNEASFAWCQCPDMIPLRAKHATKSALGLDSDFEWQEPPTRDVLQEDHGKMRRFHPTAPIMHGFQGSWVEA